MGNLVERNGPNILKQENCYIKTLKVNNLPICGSMYIWIIKISHLISKEEFRNKF